jgi:hypothetical protein
MIESENKQKVNAVLDKDHKGKVKHLNFGLHNIIVLLSFSSTIQKTHNGLDLDYGP